MPPASAEEGQQVMAAWTAWFDGLGGAVVERGNPTSETRTIGANGSASGDGSGVTGYSVVRADSLDGAVGVARGCPHLASGGTVEVVQVDALM
jgi:hypothetical protein